MNITPTILRKKVEDWEIDARAVSGSCWPDAKNRQKNGPFKAEAPRPAPAARVQQATAREGFWPAGLSHRHDARQPVRRRDWR